MPDLYLIVLHKPGVRRAQLDLLLRSVEENWPDAFPVILNADSGHDFQRDLEMLLACNDSPYTAFACDDGVVFRPIDDRLYKLALAQPNVLCWSARLGANTTRCDPTGRDQTPPAYVGVRPWRWTDAEGDFAYPGSVDAHVFRSDHLRELLTLPTPNPTALECALTEGCKLVSWPYPLMASGRLSAYTGVPVNRVSDQSGVVHGRRHPQTVEELDARYAAGERIDLDSIDPSQVDAAHTELLFRWS